MTDHILQHRPQAAKNRKKKITLVLADGHPIVLEGMRALIRTETDFDVVAACSTDEEALRAVTHLVPSIFVVELQLPMKGGLALLRNLASQHLETRSVILTAAIGESEMAEAMRLGVRGVVLKEMPPHMLFQCVRQVHRGAMWLEQSSTAGAVERMLKREAGLRVVKQLLTRRELQVLQLVAGGLRNRDISTRLDIKGGTVKIHLHNLYEKLGIKDRVQMALYARDNGVV